MNKLLALLIFLLTSITLSAIEPITITEQTIKIKDEKNFYYVFSKGDKIIFDLKVIKGKTVKKIQIFEYPKNSLLSDFKTSGISNKEIKVNNTAVYRFKIKGGGLIGKVCKIKILRIPSNDENINFNTTVKWITNIDSTYTTKQRKKLISVDTVALDFLEKKERVHSSTNLSNSNINNFSVDLPKNNYTELSSSKVISWAYWIGVGDEGLEAFEQEKKKYLLNSSSTVSTMINPMAGLALGAYAMLSNPPHGDNVKYYFTGILNDQLVYIAEGNGVTAQARITNTLQGSFNVKLINDNVIDGINVHLKMTAILENKKFEMEEYQELTIKKKKVPIVDTE